MATIIQLSLPRAASAAVIIFLQLILISNLPVSISIIITTNDTSTNSTSFSTFSSSSKNVDHPLIRSTNLAAYQPHLSSSSPRIKRSVDDIGILPDDYHRDIAPVIDGKPVPVLVSVVILGMKVSSRSDQSFDVDIFYHNHWTDPRLRPPANPNALAHMPSKLKSIPVFRLSHSWRDRLWLPDAYFRNALRGSVSNILTPTQYFTVTNYTRLFMAVRLALRLQCEMNFVKFPFDTQTCFVNISTTMEDNNTLSLDWKMFRVGSHVDVTEFTIVSVTNESCTKKLDIGYHSCLWGKIVFKRNVGNYMIRRIIPSFIIVIMSFIGFWIPTTISPTRAVLPITALLALITQQIQSDLNVSYIYALQVWNIVCVVFVFASLCEYAIALYVMHMATKRKMERAKKEDQNQNQDQNQNFDQQRKSPNSASGKSNDFGAKGSDDPDENSKIENQTGRWSARICRNLRHHFRSTSRNSSVDKISRYLFPLWYGLFLAVFAYYCLID